MKEDAKCFIRVEKGIYEEIPYKELEKRRLKDESYKDRKFIYVNKMLMEVSKDEYIDYYREIERNRYSKKVLKKFSNISIEQQQNENEDITKDVIADSNCNVEFEIIRKSEIEWRN